MRRLGHWSLHVLCVPYARPVRWSDVAENAATVALLRIVADDGTQGVAEATLKPTWSGVSPRMLAAALEDVFMPGLVDLTPDDAQRRFARIPENVAAKALIDNALCDLTETSSEAREVAVSWTVTRDAPDAMGRDAAQAVERYGFATLKVKGGQGFAQDRDAVRAIARSVGSDVTLLVDANSVYSHQEAVAYCAMLADEGVRLVEDPCPLAPDDDFEKLQAASPLPILVDLGCTSVRDANLFLERGMRYLGTKPGRNGRSDAVQMGNACRARHCDWHVGLFGETDAGSFATLRLAAAQAYDGALPAESTLFLVMQRSLLKTPIDVADGRARLPAAPNLAALVDWEVVDSLASNR